MATQSPYKDYPISVESYPPVTLSYSLASGDWFKRPYFEKPNNLSRYIINDGAAIIFWKNGNKTVSKRNKDDEFDKELGFLFAYFYGRWNGSKATRKRVIETIKEEYIKQFLFEFFVKDNSISIEQARKYLNRLIVSK